MQVHQSIEQLPTFNNAVITIGTFDGVHAGHQKIISALKEESNKIGGETVIITFHPHPRTVVQAGEPLQLINTLEEKIRLLANANIDHLVIVPFTKEFSDQPAEAYIEHFLVENFQPKTIIIGYDHRFGCQRQGDYKMLASFSNKWRYKLIEIPKYVLEEIAISSTKIRRAIMEGDVDAANRLLGYQFFFEGLVVDGDKLGRTLGYPTANLDYTDDHKIRLGHGVYAVDVKVKGENKKGMLSIGTRPTLSTQEEKVEVNIFDFEGEIYGERIEVFVKKFLRRQERYETLDDLKAQLAADKEESLKL